MIDSYLSVEATNISNKNLDKIEACLYDVESVNLSDLLIDEYKTLNRISRAVVSLSKQEIYHLSSNQHHFIANRDFFVPVLDKLGERYGKDNIHVSLRDFGESRFSLTIIMICENLERYNLSNNGSYDKAYPCVRLMNTYGGDFTAYFTVGYAFKEDDIYPLYDSHAKTLFSNRNKELNKRIMKDDFKGGIDNICQGIFHVLESQNYDSLATFLKLWDYDFDPMEIRHWVERTGMVELKIFPKNRCGIIYKKFFALSRSPRYNQRFTLGLLHKAIHLSFSDPEFATVTSPKELEKLDNKILEEFKNKIDYGINGNQSSSSL